MPALTMSAMTMAATPSATKSMPGDVVVTWMTAAEIRPMMSAWGTLGRMTRMARQNAEMMNSGAMAPPEMVEIALPTVKLRIKPAASRTASRTRLLMSRPPRSAAATVRAVPEGCADAFWDMVCSLVHECWMV